MKYVRVFAVLQTLLLIKMCMVSAHINIHMYTGIFDMGICKVKKEITKLNDEDNIVKLLELMACYCV